MTSVADAGLLWPASCRVMIAMHLRARLGIFALLAVPGCADSVTEGPTRAVAEAITGTQRDASVYPEAVTIKVNNPANDFCTGTIVAPRVVLTAAHCVIFNSGGSWTVTAPYPASSVQTRPVTQWEEIDANFPRSNYDDQDVYRDLGFLYPDTPFNGVPLPLLSRTTSATGASVAAVGRKSVSATAGLALSAATPLLGADPGYPNDYQTRRLTDGGDSGGGLFLEGTHSLIGSERVFDTDSGKDFWVEYSGPTYDAIIAKIAGHGGFMTLDAGSARVGPMGTQAVSVTVGGGGPYTYTVTSSNGATIGAAGLYKAGSAANVSDVVTVTDGRGHTGTVGITVGAGVSVAPAAAMVAPRGKLTFSAKDGSGGGYVYTLATNGSGGAMAANAYTAGAKGGVSDVVHVVDANGSAADAMVAVTAGVSITPATPSTPAKGRIALTAVGGSGSGYTWKLATNNSGGTIDGDGHYTAGATSPVNDEVTVTDSLGNTQTVQIPVGFPLSIRDSGALPPRGTVELVAIGGSGTGYAWSITVNNSGGSIDANGNYTAGRRGDVHDVVMLVDSTGAAVTGEEVVGPALAITPGDATVVSGRALTFAATGGSGAGFTFTLDEAPSGGKIDAATYTAGRAGNVTDVVTAHDPLGNTAVAHIAVLPEAAMDAGMPASAAAPDAGCHAAGHGAADGTFALVVLGLLVAGSRRRGSHGRA